MARERDHSALYSESEGFRFKPHLIRGRAVAPNLVMRLTVTFGSKYVKNAVINIGLKRLPLKSSPKLPKGQPSSS